MGYKWIVRRRVPAYVMLAALPFGALYSPYLHAHVHEDDDHHRSTIVHAHVAGHASDHDDHAADDGPAIHEADHDRAVYLESFVAVHPASVEPPVVNGSAFEFVAPAEQAAHISVVVTHGHDPPWRTSLGLRAPPNSARLV